MADTNATVNLNYIVGGNAISVLRQIRDLQREIADLQRQSGTLGYTANPLGGATRLGGQNQGMNWSSGFGVPNNSSGSGSLSWQSAMSAMPQMMGRMILVGQESNSFLRSILLHVQLIGQAVSGGRSPSGAPTPGSPRGARGSRVYEGLVGMARRYGGPVGVLASTVGPAGMALGGAMLANYATQGALNTATEATNMMSRQDLSEAQRARRMNENIPVAGSLLRSAREFSEALTGMTETIRQQNVNIQRWSLANQAEATFRQEFSNQRIAANSAAQIAAGYGAASPVAFQSFDRGTVAGQMAFSEQARRMPHLQAIASAQRAAGAARARSSATIDEANRVASRADRLRFMRDQALGNLSPLVGPSALSFGGQQQPQPGNVFGGIAQNWLSPGAAGLLPTAMGASAGGEDRPGILGAAGTAQHWNELYSSAEQERIRLLRESQNAMRESARAESTLRRANIGLLREEINILQTREQMVSQGAQRLGVMNPLQRRLGVMAAEMIQERGIENVPWFMIQHAQQVAPNLIGRQAERAGEQTIEMQRLRELGEFGTATQPLSELRQAIDNMSQQLNLDILRDEQLTTNAELATVNSNLEEILTAVRNLGGTTIVGHDINLIVQNANN